MFSQTQTQPPNASDRDINVKDVEDLPTDTVSNICWATKGVVPTFATSDWASFIRIYQLDPDTKELTQNARFDNDSPCLSVRWNEDETKLFTGCADGVVNSFDLPSGGKCEEIGKHNGPVKSVHWLSEVNILVTLSFDKTLRFWDLRQDKPVAGFGLDHKVYCSDLLYPYLAIGLSDAKILTVDLANVQSQLEGRINYVDSPLGTRSQLTAIKLAKVRDRLGVGTSSNDGRCNISIYRTDISSKLENVMTFKAQKIEEGKTKQLFPVNSIGFYPDRGYNFMYTVGGEGKMYFWDVDKKDKIADFDFNRVAVTQAEIDSTGKYIAYSLGYDWARGIQDHMSKPSKVCVHELQPRELESMYDKSVNYPIRYN